MIEFRVGKNVVKLDDDALDMVKEFLGGDKFHFNIAGRGYVSVRNYKDGKYHHRGYVHRIIMGPIDAGLVVDHIDGDPLNNQRSNLRVCTQSDNLGNQRRAKNNPTGFKGVVLVPEHYVASICRNRKCRRLGMFKTAEEAARAYDRAARELFGEFAKTNFEEPA